MARISRYKFSKTNDPLRNKSRKYYLAAIFPWPSLQEKQELAHRPLNWCSDALRVRISSDARLPADLRKGVTDNIEIMPQLVQGFGYALGVFQDLNTTCVWIILHSKWALNCFGKFSHLLFCIFKAFRHKVDILKSCDETLLFAGNLGVKGLYFGMSRKCMFEFTDRRK